MSTPPGTTRRLEQLEALAVRQRQLLQGERPPKFGATRWVHLARTITTGGAYPAVGNTFGLQFIDREFTPAQGIQAATDAGRSGTSQAVGRTLDGRWLAEGTVVLAIPTPKVPGTSGKGRWQIMPLTEQFRVYLGKSSGTIPQNGSGDVVRYAGGTELPTIATDTVENKWPTIDDDKWVIYGSIDGTYYVLAPSGGVSTQSGIPFFNNSGETIPPHAVMQVPDAIITDQVYLAAQKPGKEFDLFWLVNGPDALAPLATAEGNWLFETTGPVAIASQYPDPLDFIGWGPLPDSWELWPFGPHFSLLSSTSYVVNGQRVSDFKQREATRVYGKLVQDLKQGQSAEFKIWYRGIDDTISPAPWDAITVWDFWMNKGDKVKNGTKGVADWWTNHWEGDFACDVDNTNSSQQSPGANQDQSFALSGAGGQGVGGLGATAFALASSGSTGTGIGTK